MRRYSSPNSVAQIVARLLRRALRDARRVGTHVRDETDRALVADLDALVEILREAHRALRAERRASSPLPAAACDVVNGADGFLRRSRRLTSVTPNVFATLRDRRGSVCALGLVVASRLLAVDVMQLGGELLPVLLEQRLDRSSTRPA